MGVPLQTDEDWAVAYALRVLEGTGKARVADVVTTGFAANWGTGVPTADNPAALLAMYREWVFACVSKNAQGVSATPLRVYVAKPSKRARTYWPTRGIAKSVRDKLEARPGLRKWVSKAEDLEEVTEHPLLDLWYDGNPYLTGSQLQSLLVMHMDLVGDAWLLKEWQDGILKYLHALSPTLMRVRVTKGTRNYLAGYIYGSGQEEELLNPEEVMHIFRVDPANPVYGKAPLEAVGLIAALYHDMNVYELSLMRKSGTPGGLIIAKEGISPADKARIEYRYNEQYAGPARAGRMHVIEGDIEYKQVGLSQREMLMPQGRQLSREDIAGVFDVPLSILLTKDVNRATAREGAEFHALYGIRPRCTLIEDQINRDLVPAYPESHIFAAFDDPTPHDEEMDLLRRESDLTHQVRVVNEVRREDGLEDVEWGDLPIVGLGVGPMGIEEPSQEGQEGPPAAAGGLAKHILEQKTKGSRFSRLERVLRDYGRRVLAHALRGLGLRKGAEKAQSWEWLDREEWAEQLAGQAKPIVGGMFQAGAQAGLRRLGTGYAFDIGYPEVSAYLDREPLKFAREISETLDEQLRGVIKVSLEAGESGYEMRTRITDEFTKWQAWEAERIARTEEARAMSHGQLESWRQSGVVERVAWQASPMSCDICKELDGKAVSLGEMFAPDAYEDVTGPPRHPNCTCALVPMILGE